MDYQLPCKPDGRADHGHFVDMYGNKPGKLFLRLNLGPTIT